jgi:peptidoglycan/LPS O-acetylase OafA/YrhL
VIPSPIAKGRTFLAAFEGGKNSFGFLRLLLALFVLFSHSFDLGGFGYDPLERFSHRATTFGILGVMGFFAISGFLITRSMDTSRSVVVFLWNRFLRIYPAFLACLVVIVVLFVPIYCRLEGRDVGELFQTHLKDLLSFVTRNAWIEIQKWSIPPLLAKVPHKDAIDGSLWSLIYEWRCYLIVAVLGIFVCLRGWRWMFLGVALFFWLVALARAESWTIVWQVPVWFRDKQTLLLAPCFFAAGLAYLFRHRIPNNGWLAAAAAAFFLASIRFGWVAPLRPLCIVYVVLWLAFNLPARLSWFDEVGDVSYGVYIYAFPVQQACALAHLNRWGVVPYALMSAVATGLLAIASYRFIEKPALKLKRWDPTFGLARRVRALMPGCRSSSACRGGTPPR